MKVGCRAEEILAVEVGLAITAHTSVSHNGGLVARLVEGQTEKSQCVPACPGSNISKVTFGQAQFC